ncbi:TetR/AcrR family transcriptional regulator [Neobacillus sp. YX16]|uniref:TetR/AcrR family transcriptional regulator n=1 Tax=Neobacillus sp. YX16 TaxID=3047874 RepID=UPI0024C47268|nr:TetR/AcrR family transcriptional regulator [Neobacillus sp. YX16]WHZ02575.1 TetR/AcrR family transcriptional regulator [Neobacillus sp. YX16]
MPKQTFFHLSKDKQDTLIHAAKQEFSRVPLHEASIANIIKSAGIPRGSFYQYFEDKDDLFYYLLNQLAEKNNQRFISVLNEKNGDLFETFIATFEFMINVHRNEEHNNFFKNVYLNMNYKHEKTLAKNVYEENQKSQFLNTLKLIDTSNLNIQDEQELHHVLKILMGVTFQNIVQLFVREYSGDEALKNYLVQMDLLKRGLQKK